jgi:hypothetical protein
MTAYAYPISVLVFGLFVFGAVSVVPWLDRLQKRLERDLERSIEQHAKDKAAVQESERVRSAAARILNLPRFF